MKECFAAASPNVFTVLIAYTRRETSVFLIKRRIIIPPTAHKPFF